MEKGIWTGVRSGHNRKWFRDYIKMTDSRLRMNFCRGGRGFAAPLRGFSKYSKVHVVTLEWEFSGHQRLREEWKECGGSEICIEIRKKSTEVREEWC